VTDCVRKCVMMAPIKNKTSPTDAAIPIAGTRKPTSSPSAPAALRMPKIGSHGLGTPNFAIAVRTFGERRKSRRDNRAVCLGF
jgi:hypothetical protein